MKILQMEVGGLATNCYIPYNEETMEGVVIDPGAEGDAIVKTIGEHKLTIKAIFLTHGHNDHIGGLEEVRRATGAPVYMAEADAPKLINSRSVTEYGKGPVTFAPAEHFVADGEEVKVAGITFKFVATPGHTKGGICIIVPEVHMVFCGDTVFAESIGRTDLPGGSYEEILASIRSKILTLSDEYRLLPGHGPATSVGWERRRNPFLQ